MNIIIPMAGMGTRMRPHTLTTPKPLLEIAGVTIVERLIRDLAKMVGGEVDEVAFIIGDFGKKVEDNLHAIAASLGYKSKIYYQLEALGTAHALWFARESMQGPVLVAYADTLFSTDFKIDSREDGYIWTKQIEDPSQFGVVVPDINGYITRFVEKSKELVSDLAIIGIYYFGKGEDLKKEIDHLIDNNIRGNNEYQLTDALENMKANHTKFKVAKVDGWFDCGNKNATVDTNKEILKLIEDENLIDESVVIENCEFTGPCYIGKNVKISGGKIGPYVSIGEGTIIENSEIENCIIYSNTHIKNASLSNSMLGNYVKYEGVSSKDVSLGDYSSII
ncbi:MAG: nucleotidyltransferase [Bacteroidetes bacterium]|nr:nucleotidyltransferase [Bacteroidota bacterium]